MGTLLGGDLKLWRALALACREAGVALVLAHGGRWRRRGGSLDVHHAAAFLPYRAVLPMRRWCITHGGSNTVLDALSCGVPLLVRPVGFDQPGNLARVRHHGLGEEAGELAAARLQLPSRSSGWSAMRDKSSLQQLAGAGEGRRAARCRVVDVRLRAS
jgi:UDP:flavonoid glycosyltransferase YjiC (YdhE family)